MGEAVRDGLGLQRAATACKSSIASTMSARERAVIFAAGVVVALIALRMRWWGEWIPSKANIADLPSRDDVPALLAEAAPATAVAASAVCNGPSNALLAERFQIKGGKIYSELMHGYLQCSGGQLSEMVKGFPGETLYEETEVYHFNLTRVSRLELDDARRLRDASRHIEGVQTKQLGSFVALAKQSGAFSGHGGGGPASRSSHRGSKIALCVPMTSRGTDMSTVDQSPLWFNLFASFMESIDWQNNVHEFTFYLGLDRGDPLYDTGDAWSDLRRAFAKNTRRALTWLNFQNLTQRGILNQKLHL